MTKGIKYIAYGAASGQGIAALAYIHALHHAGVPVWPFFQPPLDDGRGPAPLRLRRAVERDANFADLSALMHDTRRSIPYDTIVAHRVPEDWPGFAESGKRLVGYSVWDTDTLPDTWGRLLNQADRILVPCRMNAEVFARGGVTRPVRIVPHVRRNAWTASARKDGDALRARLGIPADHFVFYTIGVWNPRKAHADLIDTFAREFSAEDRVTLLVKTSSKESTMAAGADSAPGIREQVSRIVRGASRARGRPSANVVGVAASGIDGGVVEAIHAVGDAYVSLTHGEGWGLGAFDAAPAGDHHRLGRPSRLSRSRLSWARALRDDAGRGLATGIGLSADAALGHRRPTTCSAAHARSRGP